MKNKGSTTLEACVLIPMVFTLSLFILFAAIVLYDRTALDYALESAVIRGSEKSDLANDKLADYVAEEFSKAAEGRLILCRGETDAAAGLSSVAASYTGYTDLPFTGLMSSTRNSIDTALDCTKKALRTHRCRITRAVAMIRNIKERKDDNNDETP